MVAGDPGERSGNDLQEGGDAVEGEDGVADDAFERLLAERGSSEAFAAAIVKARAEGVSEQAILEARFLHEVDRQDDAAIAALMPDFVARKESFKLADSAIFATTEDWLATVEYVQAVAALGKGDKEAFKRHITEAFWLSPAQGAAFAPSIEKLRLDEAMKSVRIDFDAEFDAIGPSGRQSLKKILGGGRALLLHFWSPWSPDAEEGMPDFKVSAAVFAAHGIAVASILPDASGKMLGDAREFVSKNAGTHVGAWILDDSAAPLHRLLRVRSFPTVVLVSPAGGILFNGDPGSDDLWEELGKLDPGLRRPASPVPSGEP